ncbi:MG284/MPN403 family protein [Metamycoplasma hyosynoviae]|uniref:Uncharacterized protein n=2 Tax=Metamycoplasma hyosynoviae TaxID=29559 RepID=A0A9Q9BPC5_9BACT|nr:hypothetical protein [Metamycoplasma hyosynoviae]MDC8920410.1 hypothetical protein [Metamycoplasma hyosynoviae]MDD7895504.1 hypothetical protein [Metamycoplasma hyosynoviae]MDD7912624.1 hypothetical protein [Metamycoplasma hyosynoviae]UTO25787.1 hypothetical protein NMG93_02835 [Metamycoplasma hyosynoviae]
MTNKIVLHWGEQDLKMGNKEKFAAILKYFNLIKNTKNLKTQKNIQIVSECQKILGNTDKLLKLRKMLLASHSLLMKTFLASLPSEYRLIYDNDILQQVPNRKWYLHFFSKSTYYRKLNELLSIIWFLMF